MVGRLSLVVMLLATPLVATAQAPDDVALSYSLMRITDTTIGGVYDETRILRQNLAAEMGFNAFTVGAIYQLATSDGPNRVGETEHGLMLTLGHELIVADFLTLSTAARVGVDGGTDESQPLYATDTDLRLKLTMFSSEGLGPLAGRALHPSLFAGGILNVFGRIQLTGGGGLWWNGIGFHIVGLYAFNGVEDPLNPGKHADKAYAFLKNAGVSLSLGYDFDVSPQGALHIEARKNFAFANSGNDLVFVIQYRHFFDEALVDE